MYKILKLNNIASDGLLSFDSNSYHIGDEVTSPDAILVRSYDMHEIEISPNLLAVGRAGSGDLRPGSPSISGANSTNSDSAGGRAEPERRSHPKGVSAVIAGYLGNFPGTARAQSACHRLTGPLFQRA